MSNIKYLNYLRSINSECLDRFYRQNIKDNNIYHAYLDELITYVTMKYVLTNDQIKYITKIIFVTNIDKLTRHNNYYTNTNGNAFDKKIKIILDNGFKFNKEILYEVIKLDFETNKMTQNVLSQFSKTIDSNFFSCINKNTYYNTIILNLIYHRNFTFVLSDEEIIFHIDSKYIFQELICKLLNIPFNKLLKINKSIKNTTNISILKGNNLKSILNAIIKNQPFVFFQYVLNYIDDAYLSTKNTYVSTSDTNTYTDTYRSIRDNIYDAILFESACCYADGSIGILYDFQNDAYFSKLKYILENKTNIPLIITRNSYNNILSHLIDLYQKDSQYIKKLSRSDTYENKIKNIAEIIDMLINYGYHITYDDLKNALKHGVFIKRYYLFNIKFDVTYLYICYHLNIFPYDNTNIEPDITCLLLLFKKKSDIKNIKNLINKLCVYKDFDLGTVIQKSCKHASYEITQFLISKGAKVDYTCLKNVMINDKLNHVGNHYVDLIKNLLIKNDPKNEYSYLSAYRYYKDKFNSNTYYDSDLDEVSDDFEKDLTTITTTIVNSSDINKVNTIDLHNTDSLNMNMHMHKNIICDYENDIYNKIPTKTRDLLNLELNLELNLKLNLERKSINYLEFRKYMLMYFKNNSTKPICKHNKKNLTIDKINDWICSFLS
jgi:hypothetical protein